MTKSASNEVTFSPTRTIRLDTGSGLPLMWTCYPVIHFPLDNCSAPKLRTTTTSNRARFPRRPAGNFTMNSWCCLKHKTSNDNKHSEKGCETYSMNRLPHSISSLIYFSNMCFIIMFANTVCALFLYVILINARVC